jgi:hypothetical protein
MSYQVNSVNAAVAAIKQWGADKSPHGHMNYCGEDDAMFSWLFGNDCVLILTFDDGKTAQTAVHSAEFGSPTPEARSLQKELIEFLKSLNYWDDVLKAKSKEDLGHVSQ